MWPWLMTLRVKVKVGSRSNRSKINFCPIFNPLQHIWPVYGFDLLWPWPMTLTLPYKAISRSNRSKINFCPIFDPFNISDQFMVLTFCNLDQWPWPWPTRSFQGQIGQKSSFAQFLTPLTYLTSLWFWPFVTLTDDLDLDLQGHFKVT